MLNSVLQDLFNQLLGDELIAHLQYLIASKVVTGTDYDSCTAEFKEHSDEELEHFNKLLDLMVQRNLYVNEDLLSLISESRSGYIKMLGIDSNFLVRFQHDSEVKAIKAYTDFLNLLNKEPQKDYALIKEIESILNDENQHKIDLEKLSSSINASPIKTDNENFSDWVSKADVKHGVLPEGTFTGDAKSIVNKLLNNSKDKSQAIKRLNFYINRAGDNLSNKTEIMKAKDILIK